MKVSFFKRTFHLILATAVLPIFGCSESSENQASCDASLVTKADALPNDSSPLFTASIQFLTLTFERTTEAEHTTVEVQANSQVFYSTGNERFSCPSALAVPVTKLARLAERQDVIEALRNSASCGPITSVTEKIDLEVASGVWIRGETSGCSGLLTDLRDEVQRVAKECAARPASRL